MEDSGGGGGNHNNGSLIAAMSESLTTTHALVAYLRMEADLADEKAKRLRAQAAALSERFGVTDEMQSQYELNPESLPPMDENGLPKYKGKKRGRKPKPRKRKLDPNRRKRQHTAYTLFVHEIYPGVKAQHPDLQSKDVISIVAKQWKEQLTAEEKKAWKTRAKATHVLDDEEEDQAEVGEADDEGAHQLETVGGEAEATAAADAVYQQTVAEMEGGSEEDENDDDDDLELEQEEEGEEDEEDEEPEEPPPRRRRGRPKKT